MRPFTRTLAALGTLGAVALPGSADAGSHSEAPLLGPELSLHGSPPLVAPGSHAVATLFASAARAAARDRALRAARAARAARAHRAHAAAVSVRRMVAAGDRIARLPYVWGGGHGSFSASGYDCSGSVSYVLHAAGLISTPEDSVGLESFGEPGPGRHITVYANSGHAWMTVDGRRFDTIALQETGTRWSPSVSSGAGYTVRHPAGL